jgi:DNA polymerase III subunit epsilon
MLAKLFSKEYPLFWKNYIASFNNPSTKYVILRMDVTGINPEKDKIISIACVSAIKNKIILKDAFEIYIDNNSKELQAISNTEIVNEQFAIETFLNYLGNAIIVGHRINDDMEMIDEALRKMKLGKLRNNFYDIEAMFNKYKETNAKSYSLEEIVNQLQLPSSAKNSVADDANAIALVFLKLKEKLGVA